MFYGPDVEIKVIGNFVGNIFGNHGFLRRGCYFWVIGVNMQFECRAHLSPKWPPFCRYTQFNFLKHVWKYSSGCPLSAKWRSWGLSEGGKEGVHISSRTKRNDEATYSLKKISVTNGEFYVIFFGEILSFFFFQNNSPRVTWTWYYFLRPFNETFNSSSTAIAFHLLIIFCPPQTSQVRDTHFSNPKNNKCFKIQCYQLGFFQIPFSNSFI